MFIAYKLLLASEKYLLTLIRIIIINHFCRDTVTANRMFCFENGHAVHLSLDFLLVVNISFSQFDCINLSMPSGMLYFS